MLAALSAGVLARVLAGVQDYCIRRRTSINVSGADTGLCQQKVDRGVNRVLTGATAWCQQGPSRVLTRDPAGCWQGVNRVLTGKLAGASAGKAQGAGRRPTSMRELQHRLTSRQFHNLLLLAPQVSDIAIAVREGTDAVMLSGESAYGQFPYKAVDVMCTVAKHTEASMLSYAVGGFKDLIIR